jgi:hypothetical protein
MRTQFEYLLSDGTRCLGLLTAEDALCGPLSLYLNEGEVCLTFAGGSCQAGGVSALMIRQELDAIVKFDHYFSGCGELDMHNLLQRFTEWAGAGRGNLAAVVRQLLADYLEGGQP